ncbi:hypothetical protein ACXR2U_00305 [Jatrophihabitans sp. YIM 134969]
MRTAATRLALGLLGTSLLAGALVAAGPALADTAPQRPVDKAAPPAGAYTALTPTRLVDTRSTAPIAPGGTLTLPVLGKGGVPGNAGSVVLNVTAVKPTSSGYLTVWPDGTKPVVSNVNFGAGQIVANLVTVKVGADGSVRIYNGSGGSTNVLVDVSGAFTVSTTPTAAGAFAPLNPPKRLLDTRSSVAVPAKGTRKLQVTGSSVPAAAGAVALTVTAVTPSAGGYITLYPGGTRPTTAAVNFTTGRTVATAAAVKLAGDGSVTIYNGSGRPLQVLVDAAGWFRGSTGNLAGTFSFLSPARILDTRTGVGRGGRVGPVPASTAISQAVGGAGGIPVKGVSAVVLTVTVTGGTGSGYLTVYPDQKTRGSSTLNFTAGQTVTNLVVVPVTPVDDQLQIAYYNGSGGTLSVIADVSGFVRSSDVVPPGVSTSRYVNDLLTADSDGVIREKMYQHGQDDAVDVNDPSDRTVLLEFGAQSNKVPNEDGGLSFGVLPPNTQGNSQRLTYAQVVTAVKGYLDGFASARGESASGVITVAVGTSNDGYRYPTGVTPYLPADKGADWASEVVKPLVSYGSNDDITVVGANDIEANFDGTAAEVKVWVQNYLSGNSLQLINNGSAAACPTVLGQANQSCGAVRVDGTTTTQTWQQSDYVDFSYGIAPTRISVLPQIYFPENATQWQNINLTSGARVEFAGVLTQVAACGTDPGCGDLSPADAWTAMRQALDSNDTSAQTTLATATDIRYDS